MEVGFSCMGGEIPTALGVRMARPGRPARSTSLIGDGTYLMGNTSELVTARQEGLKVTVLVVENERLPVDPRAPAQPHRAQLRPRVPRASRRRGPRRRLRRGRLRGERPQPRLRGVRRVLARRAARRARRAARDETRAGGDRGARRAAPAAARLGLLVGRRRGARSPSAPRRASWPRSTRAAGRSSATTAEAVRIVATAEVPGRGARGVRAARARSRSNGDAGERARRRRGADRARHAPRRGADRRAPPRCGRSRAPAPATTTSTSRPPPARGIPIVYAPGVGSRPVAEGTRRADPRGREAPARARRGRARARRGSSRYEVVGLDLEGACLGIVGLGAIGRRVARCAARSGCA